MSRYNAMPIRPAYVPRAVDTEKFLRGLGHAALFALPLWAVILKLLGII